MDYTTYLKFYGIKENKQSHEDWLASEWNHGRVYKYKGEYFSTTTGEKIK